MPTKQSIELKELLKGHVDNITISGASSAMGDFPNYEIHPRDFFSYAEDELDDLKSNRSIVNCVSNLKRAVDCQIDIFMHALNLQKHYKEKRLGVDRKLGFIEKCGLFNKKSLSRINTIRNKLEHHYQLPSTEDIDLYFDLIFAFIAVLENSITGINSELEFDVIEWVGDDIETKKVGQLTSQYVVEKTEMKIIFTKNRVAKEFVANSDNLEELAYFIKIHYLLTSIRDTFHCEYANAQLKKL